MKKILVIINLFLSIIFGFSQDSILVKFYLSSESGKEFIQNANFHIVNENKNFTDSLTTDEYGFLEKKLVRYEKYRIKISARFYKDTVIELDLEKRKENDLFEKIRLQPSKGYYFEISLTDYNPTNEKQIGGITDATIQIYNDKQGVTEDIIKNAFPYFKLLLKDSSIHTILITKPGYFSKVLTLKINNDACVLCFDGVKKLRESRNDELPGNNPFFNAEIELEKFDNTKTFIFRDINFENSNNKLNSNSKSGIIQIWKILKYNPGISFELGAHTDSRGSETLNLEISQQRLNLIIQLLKLNQKTNNYYPIAYGEAKILNKCKDNINCTEEEHSYNRRFELRPIGLISDENIEQISLSELLNEENTLLPNSDVIDENDFSDTIQRKSTGEIIEPNQDKQYSETENKGKFKIIAGSFKNIENANNIKKQIINLGIKADVEVIEDDKLIKVLVGKYKTEGEAREIMTKLRDAGIECYLSH
jgi:outer membrane protein OmpA-like peptidoglycan-associated protein